MKKSSEFVVPFAGIKLGVHHYNFEVTQTFFEELTHLQLEKGVVKIQLELEKKETMMLAFFSAIGDVQQACCRCNDLVEVNVNTELSIIYKLGTEESEDENLVVLHPDSYEIDAYQPIYEMLIMALSANPTHEEGFCNQEMITILNAYMLDKNESNIKEDKEDPRWAKLKNLN